jgi:hypothetical protein
VAGLRLPRWLGAVVEAARELTGVGTYSFWERAVIGREAAERAFGS